MALITAKVGTLPNGTMGFDIDSPLTAATAAGYIVKGFEFVARYVGRGDGSKAFVDLTLAEAQLIVDAGLGLCVVQHPLNPGWSPTVEKGLNFGQGAVAAATAAGLLPGTSIFLDLEGVSTMVPSQTVIDYCNTWFDQVRTAGFTPGIYIGDTPGITADQLYWDLKVKSYWRGGSSVAAGVPADIPQRGYQMTQRIIGSGKTEFDQDVIKTDNFGGGVQWCLQA